MLSSLLVRTDDVTGAKLAARRAYDQDAFLSNIDIIVWRLFTLSLDDAQFTEAAHWCEVGSKRFPKDPNFVECQLDLMGTKAVAPDPALAWKLADSVVKLTPESTQRYAAASTQLAVGAVLARAGLADSAKHVVAHANAPQDVDPTRDLEYSRAFAWTLLGDKSAAIKSLAIYLSANPTAAVAFNSDNNWRWRSIADDPRFERLIVTAKQ